ncbi:MAG: archaetidylinositol phosphate synthase, partial [Methanobacterium sp.]|nr:archaetidylinositol phosphate synthase [Methanobacterium sp.]
MLNHLRPKVKLFLDPIAKRIHVNPNILTIIGLLISFLSAYMFATCNLLFGAVFIALSGFVDMLDGAVARNNSQATKFGGVLDSTTDRFGDAFIIIGIIYGGYVNWILGILALHASLTVSYVRARAESENIECNVGIAERAERLVIIMLGAFLYYFTNIQLSNMNPLEISIVIIMILGYVTVLQ